jgi:cytidine deaminase
MCRQAMLEYEVNAGKPIRVILGGHSGKVIVIEGVSQLLPLAFMEKGLIR